MLFLKRVGQFFFNLINQMQSFLLPKSILLNLYKTCRNFFWNKDNTNNSPNLIGWDRIFKPKSAGD